MINIMIKLLDIILCKLFWFIAKSKGYNSRKNALFYYKYHYVLCLFFSFFIQVLFLCFCVFGRLKKFRLEQTEFDSIILVICSVVLVSVLLATIIHKYMIRSLKRKRIIFNIENMQDKRNLFFFLLFLFISHGGGIFFLAFILI